MNYEEAITLVDELGELRAMADVLAMDKQTALDAAMPEAVRLAIAAIQEEFADKETAVNERIGAAEAKVKKAVTQLGQTVTGEHIQAVYVGPKRKWDGKKLDGYAAAHPEIEVFVSTSRPYVTIRSTKR